MRSSIASALLYIFALASASAEGPTSPKDDPPDHASSFPADGGHWAFLPPSRTAPPRAVDGASDRNPIDAFLGEKIEAAGLRLAPEADRGGLLRRLSYDLTGLPPTDADMASFLGDDSTEAYDKQVDRYLESPSYGVRWAQHWLDLVQYGDSDGFDPDAIRPYTWRYRDWVVYALNRDMPFDEFVRMQIAGDEINPGDPMATIATGFLRSHPEMTNTKDRALRRQVALQEVTETVGSAFLGLTYGCARCHDHKTDPIKHAEFYQLQAFFAGAQFNDAIPIATKQQRDDQARRLRERAEEIASIQSDLIRLGIPTREARATTLPTNLPHGVMTTLDWRAAEKATHDITRLLSLGDVGVQLGGLAIGAALEPTKILLRRRLLARLDDVVRERPAPIPVARGVLEEGPNAPPTYILRRGNFADKRGEAVPGFPAALCRPGQPAVPVIPPLDKSSGRRKLLAEWLTSPDHPLTQRVIVNRLWQHHFGRGIVATPSDFGLMGDSPSHPELLDWLATELVQRRWSMKEIHRIILKSRAYRQSSARSMAGERTDPGNILFHRQSRRRLDAEEVRDTMLLAAGVLDAKRGGPGVHPVAESEDMPGSEDPSSVLANGRNRRSLYLLVRRSARNSFLELFDRADSNDRCPIRPTTMTPTQALSLLNGQFSHECAKRMAARVVREAGPRPEDHVNRTFRLAYSRIPTQDEVLSAVRFLESSPLEDFCLAIMNSNEFIFVE